MRPLAIVAATLALAACASAAPIVPTLCRPAALPPFQQWVAGHSEPRVLDDDAGRPVAAVWRLYHVGEHLASTLWIGPVLVALDLAPHDPLAPSLINVAWMDDEFRVRTSPGTGCYWKPLKPGGAERRT